jgi:hypothetical protein
LVEGLVAPGVDDDGLVVLGVVAALAMAVLSPNPRPAALPAIPRPRSVLAKRLLIWMLCLLVAVGGLTPII